MWKLLEARSGEVLVLRNVDFSVKEFTCARAVTRASGAAEEGTDLARSRAQPATAMRVPLLREWERAN